MPVSTRSYHSESTSRFGSSYSPSYSTPSYRSPLPSTYRSSYSSYRSTSGLDDTYTSSREKSDITESSYSTTRRDISKSRLTDSGLKSSSVSYRRPSAATSSYTSPDLDISRYSPANYVTGSSRLASRPSRSNYGSLRDTKYVPSSSLRTSRYSDLDTDRESSSPVKAKNSKELKGIVGLQNIGNTCFLNAILQCLSNTKGILEYILNQEYVNDTRSNTKTALMKRFAELIKKVWDGRKTSVETKSFKEEVNAALPYFNGYQQHDAQEFLRYFLQALHDELNRAVIDANRVEQPIDDTLGDSQKAVETWKKYLKRDNSKIVDSFGGLMKSTLECTHCGHCSTTFEPFWDLSLPIPDNLQISKLHLSHCIDLFTKEEILDANEMPTCSSCHTRRKCKKRILIQKFPEVLVIHLKRFALRSRKVKDAIDFPLTNLDMGAYSADSQLKTLWYDLYAVANHTGTCQNGHYTAFCKHPYSGEWHLFNDRSVVPTTEEDVLTQDAYLLFYEQTASTNL